MKEEKKQKKKIIIKLFIIDIMIKNYFIEYMNKKTS
jgi:hypothetical protein